MGGNSPGFWITASFAQAWFRDTFVESQQEGPDHRRKEVLFAVCFVESYLFETVRDFVLRMKFSETTKYFPVDGPRRGIKRRCKEVFDRLYKNGKLTKAMKWNDPFWVEFCRLVDMRDGLIHASISRPDKSDLPRKEKPTPSVEEFFALHPGWALKRARNLVHAVHESIGINAIEWIEYPERLLRH
jgi:hypothetical protein